MIKRVPPTVGDRPGEGRLSRWSRLKQESRAEKEKPPVVAEAEKAAVPALADRPAPDAAEHADDPVKDLPPLESLTKDSDYSAFMREGVPEDMRAQALRKLWASDPAFREPFPFEMHMEDYNATFIPMDAAKDTIYRLGRGFLTPEDLVAEKAEKEEAAKRANLEAGKDAAVSPPSVACESSVGTSEIPEEKKGQAVAALPAAVDKSEKPA